MIGPSPTVCHPLDGLPDGTVKVPLGLPHGAAWPVVAQVAALSQRRAGCTASIGFLADRLSMHPSTIYDALNAAGAWIITDASTRTTRRYLAPFPETAWARISYRAAAGVGCRSVDGVWTPRRNRSALLELYCRLRRDEAVGAIRSQAELAQELEVTDRTVRSLLIALEVDGWISSRRAGRMIAYRTHDAPLHVVDAVTTSAGGPSAEPADQQEHEPTAERSRNVSRTELGISVETISESEPLQKLDPQTGLEKHDCSPLAVGDVQHRSAAPVSALPRERHISEATDDTPPKAPRPRGALSVLAAIPLAWQQRMSQADRERVLAAVEKEMSHGRTVAQMTARVRQRLAMWYGIEPRRPVAVALAVVHRGYGCPHPECEDHLLPSGHPCPACEEIGARINQQRREGPGPGEPAMTDESVRTDSDQLVATPAEHLRKHQERPSQKLDRIDVAGPDDGWAERARALLLATCPRTAATMRASAARKGQKLPEPSARIAG
jgi:DNA-binding transcriptional ArsR family regulator